MKSPAPFAFALVLALCAASAHAKVVVVSFERVEGPSPSAHFIQPREKARVFEKLPLQPHAAYLVAAKDTDTHLFSGAVAWRGRLGYDAAAEARMAQETRAELDELNRNPQGYLDSPEAASTRGLPEGNRDRVVQSRRKHLENFLGHLESAGAQAAAGLNQHRIGLLLADDAARTVFLSAAVPADYPFAALSRVDARECERLGADLLARAPQALDPAVHRLKIDTGSGSISVVDRAGKAVSVLVKAPREAPPARISADAGEKALKVLQTELPR